MNRGRVLGGLVRAALMAAGLLLAAGAAPAAWAGQAVTLKAEVSSGASVTLGDLFDGAGSQAATVIGNGAPPGESAVLDAASVRQIASAHGLDWDNPDAISRIIVPRGQASTPNARMTEALAWAHSISAGDLIQPEDLTFSKIASFAIPPDAPRDADQIIGKVARRPLRAGTAVAARDVSSPQVIKANDAVQVAYSADGVTLVLQGKAMGSAAVGDAVEIMNPVSKKVIQAIASGADEAVVGPEAERLRARPFTPSNQLADLR
jgi:flagella basal body P-ring formation protein FlgA